MIMKKGFKYPRHPECPNCHAERPLCNAELVSASKAKAFTLAEVLITLAIIGVVAALTIPSVVRNYQELQYKTAYKKAYSDLSRAFASAIAFGELVPRSDFYDLKASQSEWDVMKKNFKAIKDCSAGQTFSCWVNADRVCTGSCNGPNYEEGAGGVPNGGAGAFIDSSGRAWAHYAPDHSIYLVDTNGAKGPNQFGKDRWMFSTKDAKNNSVTSGLPAKITPFLLTDYLTKNNWCQHPPCYYKSWLSQ